MPFFAPYPPWVSVSRIEYVLDHDGWDEARRLAATRRALMLVAADATDAETDIPWHLHKNWPQSVAEAAERLRDRFVREDKRTDDYMQTGVEPLADEVARGDFLTFVPYAYDATIWADGQVLASLADEGTSLVVALTAEQLDALAGAVGVGRVVTLQAWRHRQPSVLRRLIRRLRGS